MLIPFFFCLIVASVVNFRKGVWIWICWSALHLLYSSQSSAVLTKGCIGIRRESSPDSNKCRTGLIIETVWSLNLAKNVPGKLDHKPGSSPNTTKISSEFLIGNNLILSSKEKELNTRMLISFNKQANWISRELQEISQTFKACYKDTSI